LFVKMLFSARWGEAMKKLGYRIAAELFSHWGHVATMCFVIGLCLTIGLLGIPAAHWGSTLCLIAAGYAIGCIQAAFDRRKLDDVMRQTINAALDDVARRVFETATEHTISRMVAGMRTQNISEHVISAVIQRAAYPADDKRMH